MSGGGLISSLKANQRAFFEMKILLMLPETDPMELKDLKAMSVTELKNLYNEHAAKQIKRFESRAKAEERTAQLLREAGKLTETPAPAKGKAKAKPAPEPSAPAKEPKSGKGSAPAKKAAPAPAPVAGKGKGSKPAAAPKPEAEKPGRGAPRHNPVYIPFAGKKDQYNPRGFKMQAGSARAVVLAFVNANAGGKNRDEIESHFSEHEINAKAALDFLVKYGFISTKESAK